MATATRWTCRLSLPPTCSQADISERLRNVADYLSIDSTRALADRVLSHTTVAGLRGELEAAQVAFSCQGPKYRGNASPAKAAEPNRIASALQAMFKGALPFASSSSSSPASSPAASATAPSSSADWCGCYCRGDIVFANYSNWGYWPCKLTGLRAHPEDTSRVQVEIYFFPGFQIHAGAAPTEWSSDWLDADQVCSFVDNFQQLSRAVASTGSMFSWFSHDLLAALDDFVEREITPGAAARGSVGSWDEAAWYASTAAPLLAGSQKRGRWAATLDRYTQLLESWRCELAKDAMVVPVPTDLAIYNLAGGSGGGGGGGGADATCGTSADGGQDTKDDPNVSAALPIPTVRAEDDYYCVLGVSAKASSADIKLAYRCLARRYHPDKQPEGNANLFQRLQVAHATLRNTKQRRAYDAERAAFFEAIARADAEEAAVKAAEREAALLATRRSGRRKTKTVPGVADGFSDGIGGGIGGIGENINNTALPILRGDQLVTATASQRDATGKRLSSDPAAVRSWYRSMSGSDPIVEAVLSFRSPREIFKVSSAHNITPTLAPLLIAVEVNNGSMVQTILEVKPELALEATTSILHLSRSPPRAQGWTVLHHAALLGRVDMMRAIVEAANAAQDRQWFSVYGAGGVSKAKSGSKKQRSLEKNGGKPKASGGSGGAHISESGGGGGGGGGCGATRVYSRGDHYGMTPLHVAAKYGQADSVKMLISLGADPKQRCKQKFTALHWICGEKVNRGHVASAAALMHASSDLVNLPDKNGLTALHWANAEQHVGLMKLLLNRGAEWSDKDLMAMTDDVTLGHEHRPIKIDLSFSLEPDNAPNASDDDNDASSGMEEEEKEVEEAGGRGASVLESADSKSRDIAMELLSRLRRFIYIRDPVEESDEITNNSSKHENDATDEEDSRDDSSDDEKPAPPAASRKRGVAAMSKSTSKSREPPKQQSMGGQHTGCQCTNCFDKVKRCACIRKNGQYLPYEPIKDPESGAVTGMVLEQERLGMMRTRIFECGKGCANHRRFLALDQRSADGLICRSAGSDSDKKKGRQAKRCKRSAVPKLSRAELEEQRRRAHYESRWCSGLNFCQQGVSPALTLKGFRNGKGFGVVTDEPLRKGQYVCTYNAEILSADDASERETMWCQGNGELGGQEVLPETFGKLSSSPSPRAPVASSSSLSLSSSLSSSSSSSSSSSVSSSSSSSWKRTAEVEGSKRDRRRSKAAKEETSTASTGNSCADIATGATAVIGVRRGLRSPLKETPKASVSGVRCEVEFNGDWFAAVVEFDRESGRSFKCDIDGCSVIVPFAELEDRARGFGGGRTEATKASTMSVDVSKIALPLAARRRRSVQTVAEARDEPGGRDGGGGVGGSVKHRHLEGQSHEDEMEGGEEASSELLSSSPSDTSTSPPTSIGTTSPSASQTSEMDLEGAVVDDGGDDIGDDCTVAEGNGEEDENLMDDENDEKDESESKSDSDSEFVPGAQMEEVTFQIYLDKSCNNKVFDGTIFANIARFMNHSCDPNLKVIKVNCNRPYPLLAFFCTRNIDAGEELTWNYDNSGGGRKKTSGVACLCGADNCRGFL